MVDGGRHRRWTSVATVIVVVAWGSLSSSTVETGGGCCCNCRWARVRPGGRRCWARLGASLSSDKPGAGIVVTGRDQLSKETYSRSSSLNPTQDGVMRCPWSFAIISSRPPRGWRWPSPLGKAWGGGDCCHRCLGRGWARARGSLSSRKVVRLVSKIKEKTAYLSVVMRWPICWCWCWCWHRRHPSRLEVGGCHMGKARGGRHHWTRLGVGDCCPRVHCLNSGNNATGA